MTFPVAAVIAIALVLALLLVGCNQSTVLSNLTAIVDAAEIALPIIGPAAGLTPAQTAAIEAYLKAVAAFTGKASLILAGPGTPAAKSLEISQAAASIVKGCNCLPPGIAIQVDGAISAVEQAVEIFLRNFKPGPVPPVIKVTATDSAKLTKLRARSETIAGKLKTRKP